MTSRRVALSASQDAPPVLGRVAVVGPCASGKSVLVVRLTTVGYDVRQPAQEHSYVPDMWRRLARPQVLVYLDVSLPQLLRRRCVDMAPSDLAEQRRRLAHARAHCDLYVPTDPLSEEEVFHRVVAALAALGVAPRPPPPKGAARPGPITPAGRGRG